ncbi:hypothetical protein ANN_18727 [Periplaneta americana]|uniref:Uncharacterized protein n=1 Tax=Periplaneta americana TaxID=6978 RepID=A0ABQ8SQV6_PERAM|nr:hypothetical protein ANN_18727 [Periplaneta americana]
MLRFKTRLFNVIILNTHASTEEKEVTIKEEYYLALEEAYDRISNNDVKIFTGEHNTQIAQEDIYIRSIGKHSLHEITNDNGQKLAEFVSSKEMVIKSTGFAHKRYI